MGPMTQPPEKTARKRWLIPIIAGGVVVGLSLLFGLLLLLCSLSGHKLSDYAIF